MNILIDLVDFLWYQLTGQWQGSMAMAGWVIVRVESSWLRRACAELGGWFPVETRMTKPARKHKPVLSQVPLFPTWVFLPYDGGDSLEWVRTVAGVRGVVRYGKRVLILRDEDIELLRAIEKRLASHPVEAKAPKLEQVFKPGDLVSVEGLFADAPARVLEVRGADQVLVLIDEKLKMWVGGCLLSIRGV